MASQNTGNACVALVFQASCCRRPGLVFIALATLLAASHWLHTGNAGVVAGFAGFTLSSSWHCVHCASFTLAALWL